MARKQIQKQPILSISDNLIEINTIGGGVVSAGYPAEAYNYTEDEIDFNKYIIKDRQNTKCVWATNANMVGEGIDYGDLIVINTAKNPNSNSIVLLRLDDELVLKRIKRTKESIELIPIREDFKTIVNDEYVEKIGVVTHVIKKFPARKCLYSDYPENKDYYIENGMDFNKYILDLWETVFYLWAGGDSMIKDGINKGDLLIVDRMREPNEKSIVVFYINNQYTLKRMVRYDNYVELVSSHPDMKPIRIEEGQELKRWGVLTFSIKKY